MEYSRSNFMKADAIGAMAVLSTRKGMVAAGSVGHNCRCVARAPIIRTALDTGKMLGGEAEIA